MNNVPEKLKIMEWLFEREVSPDMWTGSEGHIYFDNGQGLLMMTSANSAEETDERIQDIYTPWYPLEQVIKLLYRHKDFNSIGHVTDTINIGWEFAESDDYHIVALMLLKQKMEEDDE